MIEQPHPDVGSCTHSGDRGWNHDAVQVLSQGVLVVADGLGAAPDAGRASQIAARAVIGWLSKQRGDVVAALAASPRIASAELAAAEPALDPASATAISVAVLRGGLLHVLAVGDCRVSVLRRADHTWEVVAATEDQDGLTLLTRDYLSDLARGADPQHPAADLVAASRRYVRAAVASDSQLDIETVVTSLRARAGDVVLATSDGVHDTLGVSGIVRVLTERPDGDCSDLSTRLVAQSLAEGALDNCSVAAMRVPSLTRSPL